MGEVVSSEGTVGVPGLMPALLPRNYFSYKLFSCSDAVWGLKPCYIIAAYVNPGLNPATLISLLKKRHGQLDNWDKATEMRGCVIIQVYACCS